MQNSNYKESGAITEVSESDNYFTVHRGSTVCGLKKKYGVVPKVGDLLTVHTKGGPFGSIVGMDLNGVPVFFVTKEQFEAYRERKSAEYEEKKQKEFQENKTKMDEQYAALPKVFQERIDRYRKNNLTFRVDYESYELFCCEQAVIIADTLKSPEEVQTFNKLSWEEQLKKVPGLSDGHSGNTFGCACSLAFWYLSKPEVISKINGALAPLVGSEEYGDIDKS